MSWRGGELEMLANLGIRSKGFKKMGVNITAAKELAS